MYPGCHGRSMSSSCPCMWRGNAVALHPIFARILAPYAPPSLGSTCVIDGRRIRTTFEYPPIPIRSCDWSAVDDNTYDGAPDSGPPANLVGRGATEAEAIADLLEQIEDWS